MPLLPPLSPFFFSALSFRLLLLHPSFLRRLGRPLTWTSLLRPWSLSFPLQSPLPLRLECSPPSPYESGALSYPRFNPHSYSASNARRPHPMNQTPLLRLKSLLPFSPYPDLLDCSVYSQRRLFRQVLNLPPHSLTAAPSLRPRPARRCCRPCPQTAGKRRSLPSFATTAPSQPWYRRQWLRRSMHTRAVPRFLARLLFQPTPPHPTLPGAVGHFPGLQCHCRGRRI